MSAIGNKLKRQRKLKKIEHFTQIRDSVAASSDVDESPVFGSEKIELSDIPFSCEDTTPICLNRKRKLDIHEHLSEQRLMSDSSDDEPFFGFSSERHLTNEQCVLSGTTEQIILDIHSGEAKENVSQNNCAVTLDSQSGKTKGNDSSSKSDISNGKKENDNKIFDSENFYEPHVQHFFKILCADFCQFSAVFPHPQHQCTAMAATALTYNLLKPIVNWDKNDLHTIMRFGQSYYEECLTHKRLTNPQDQDTFLEAIYLNENLTIQSDNFEIFVDIENCTGGRYESREILRDAFTRFELQCFTYGIITYKTYSYAIIRYHNTYTNTYYYVFFDSHGRNSNGTKTQRDSVADGKTAILFFVNYDKFLDFFTEEWQFVEPGSHRESYTFILVPLHILKIERDGNLISEANRMSDRVEIDSVEIKNEFPLHIVLGDFCEYDVKPAAHSQHQCSGMVLFSFIYSTLYEITTWDAESLKNILSFGNMFYQKRYDQQCQRNMEYNKISTLQPKQLAGNVSFSNFLYTIHINESDSSGYVNKKDIIESFSLLESLNIPFGILVVNDLCYGITLLQLESGTLYAFFDSHGRTNTGQPNGAFAAVLYFDNIDRITTFMKDQFGHAARFKIFPVQLSTKELSPETAKNSFTNIVTAVFKESKQNSFMHYNCVALSVCAIFYAYLNDAKKWSNSDIQECLAIGKQYATFCDNEWKKTNIDDIGSNFCNYIREINVDENSYNISLILCGRGNMLQIKDSLRKFYTSVDHQYALLTICGHTYAICKCSDSRSVLFFDVHGRNDDGTKGGELSAIIYFENINQLYNFVFNENEEMYPFLLQFVTITLVTNKSTATIRVLSGSFSQNASRFGKKSRNTQCTANSAVFLAFASIIKDRWTSSDIDAILMLGDHIYTVSYGEAIKLHPRRHTFLAAHEVVRNIFVNVNRLNSEVVNVQCMPLVDKEYSGNFEKFAKTYITRFFTNFSDGIFVCCNLSIALHKHNNEYIIFDPHARTTEGAWDYRGTANIFFFQDIDSLYERLRSFGYNSVSEFNLMPFEITHIKDCNNRTKVNANSNREAFQINEISQVSMDDIPIAESSNWLPSDNIPLDQLWNKWSPSDDLPLIHFVQSKTDVFSQISDASLVKSMPIVDKKSNNVTERDKLRRRRTQYERERSKISLSSQYEQKVRHRWDAYKKKVKRTQTVNMFAGFKNFKEFYDSFKIDDASDDELIRAADAAVEEHLQSEQLHQLRMQNNALIPTHFIAFGNHEDITESDDIYALHKLSPFDQTCPHCGALYFKEECNTRKIFRTCCNFGEIHSGLPEQLANTYPQFLRDLMMGQSPLSRHFKENILQYNNVLSFASLGTTNVHHLSATGSIGPVVAMEGMIYHVAEHFRTNTTGEDMPTAQLYYIDSNAAVSERLSRVGSTLNRSLLMQLENYMRTNNPLANAYRMLKDVLHEVRRRPNTTNANVHMEIVRNRDQIRIRQNHGGDFGVPTSNEVAAIYTHLPSSNTKNIVVFPVDKPAEEGIHIASHDPNRDALMYPLLFPFSEQTWSYNLMRRKRNENEQNQETNNEDMFEDVPNERDNPDETFAEEHDGEDDHTQAEETNRKAKPRKRITVREFFCYMLMLRMAFSPLLNAGKLTQQFIIDAYARAQDNTFEYLQSDRGQAQIRAETYGALKDYVERKKIFQPDIPGKLIVMPNDIIGSRQYMKNRYQDTLALVTKYGKPTFFVTMTCNPMWDEIQQNIPKGSNAIDYPHIVARVFHAKVKELIHDISKKHILGKCVAYVAVIEWQKRSLPHCHLVTFNSPEDRPANHVDIDNFVSAEIPNATTKPRLYKAVTTFMYHHRCDDTAKKESCQVPRKGKFQCPPHPPNGKEADNTKQCVCFVCSKHFPRKFADKSELIDNSYPIYRRRRNGRTFISTKNQEIDNRWIVPYNPQLLLKYNCHINIEITSSLKSIKYLFKYLHKGVDMARLNIKVIDNVQVYNEFDHFVDCRYLSAGEAIWKLYDFPMFYQSHTIYSLPVHLENYQNVIFDPDFPERALQHSDSMLTAYFELNMKDENARNYIYTDIPLSYVYNKKKRAWHRRQRRLDQTLGRMYMVNYNNVELYSLRLLLLTVKGAQSFQDLRTVKGTAYDTFREAAVELGLLQDDSLHIKTFEEIIDAEMPYNIRSLFVNMLLFNTPSDPAKLWHTYNKYMYEDYVRKGCSESVAMNLSLRHISRLLQSAGKTNADYSLPSPSHDTLQAEQDVFEDRNMNQNDAMVEGERLAQMLNREQRAIFDEICDSAMHLDDSSKKRLFFVDGPGGTGKTFLFSALITALNGLSLQVTPIAWTGIAASLLRGGRTVHSTFKLPLNMSGPVACHLSTLSDLAAKLRSSTVIVWDEISMSLSHALNAVDVFFRDLMGNTLPFGGKIFVATGDFRQILPIVKEGSKYDLLNVTVKRSEIWPLLENRQLRTNVRLTNVHDTNFAKWLLDIGEDEIHDLPGNQYYKSYVKLPKECIADGSLIDRIYGETFLPTDSAHYSKYAILSTVNEDVDMLNNEIYNRLTEEVCTEKKYLSTDNVLDSHPNNDDSYDVAMLNALTPPNLAPHSLKLKVGCIVMLLLNLNPEEGLCNGTRLIVTKLYDTCIRARILSGDHKDKEVLISRCRMSTEMSDVSGKLERIQIPVKLAFAMTINKSQGQTFDYVGVYFRKPPFAHGQLYVALSRVRSKEKLLIQVISDTLMGRLKPGCDDIYIPNVVHREIFQ